MDIIKITALYYSGREEYFTVEKTKSPTNKKLNSLLTTLKSYPQIKLIKTLDMSKKEKRDVIVYTS